MNFKKKITWEKKLEEVNQMADGLGKRVDDNISESVAAFLIHGFRTSGSCEGHVGHGLLFPWVEVYAPQPKGWKKAKGRKKEKLEYGWKIKNFGQQRKMMVLLEKFYNKRHTPFDARLVFNGIGVFWGFRVQSFGGEIAAVLSAKEQNKKLKLYQKEMRDFTEFLKEDYFFKK